jgi:hypothetical protein
MNNLPDGFTGILQLLCPLKYNELTPKAPMKESPGLEREEIE